MRLRLLDLFCGAGGVAVGLHRAGFDVVGVDIKPQRHYPFTFIQADALEVGLEGYDCYWASPPCQFASVMRNLPWLRDKNYPALIDPIRRRLQATGKLYVIENVYGARYGSKILARFGNEHHGMQAGWLCGTMFGLSFCRHRLFETNFPWFQPGHSRDKRGVWRSKHTLTQWGNGAQVDGCGIGHAKGWRLAAQAMGIDWMTRGELTQAIPPVYAEYIGKVMIQAVEKV